MAQAAEAPLESLSAEVRLLLLAVHRQLSPAHREQINRLAGEVDADALYTLARTHGLSMLLYRGLLQLQQRSALLDALTARLEQDVTTNAAAYELVYPQQVAKILDALRNIYVDAMVLKGVVLGLETYRQPTLRPYGDVDILVREADLDAAETCLVQLGYSPDERLHPRDWYRRYHHHLAPYCRPNALPVELHWSLAEPNLDIRSAIDTGTLWHFAQPVNLGGVSAYKLCPEHQLIHLCVHTVNVHLFEMGLLRLCDILETLAEYRNRLDWTMIARHSQQWQCARSVSLALHAAAAVFDVPTPTMDPVPDHFLAYILANTLHTSIQGVPESSRLAQAWQQPRTWKKWQIILRRLFPDSAEVAVRYHLRESDPRRWLYYPRWQVDMVRYHVGTARRLLRADQDALEQAHYETLRQELTAWLKNEA